MSDESETASDSRLGSSHGYRAVGEAVARRIEREILKNESPMYARLRGDVSMMSTESMPSCEQLLRFADIGVLDLRTDGEVPRGRCCVSTDATFVVAHPEEKDEVETMLRNVVRDRRAR